MNKDQVTIVNIAVDDADGIESNLALDVIIASENTNMAFFVIGILEKMKKEILESIDCISCDRKNECQGDCNNLEDLDETGDIDGN